MVVSSDNRVVRARMDNAQPRRDKTEATKMTHKLTFKTKCANNHTVMLNPNKHQNREKYCPVCRVVVANARRSLLDLLKSLFQSEKKTRKAETREHFIEQLRKEGLSPHQIARRLERRWEGE